MLVALDDDVNALPNASDAIERAGNKAMLWRTHNIVCQSASTWRVANLIADSERTFEAFIHGMRVATPNDLKLSHSGGVARAVPNRGSEK